MPAVCLLPLFGYCQQPSPTPSPAPDETAPAAATAPGTPPQAPNPASTPAVVNATQQASAENAARKTVAQLQGQAKDIKAVAPTITWDVLPVSVVRDNYGHNVAGKYIAIDVLIHNNDTNTQLLIRGFRFNVNSVYYANTDPTLVRGTIQKGQMVGARNRSVQAIKTLGLIATGAGGYFHATSAAANYNRGVTIFSDPFEKGIELLFPDTTTTYLANWDKDPVLKNGFVVDPGKEENGRIFLPVELVCSPNFPTPPAQGEKCDLGHFFRRNATYDANEIKHRLGTISLIGNSAAIVTGQPLQ
jgi:hypothetical protein